MKTTWIIAVLLASLLWMTAPAQEAGQAASGYQALQCPAPALSATWGILDRDGANRRVSRYLSSLANGESGTGMITSPPFMIEVDTITFTICGHDGQAGGRGENFIALVDARKGQILLKTPPPQGDAMQERTWDVRALRGTQARIEVHDANGGAGYAWLGVGRIDAGPELKIDFSKGMPAGWAESERTSETREEVLTGGVPFKRVSGVYTLIPRTGAVEIPCGFTARRLFFLGCVAAGARPSETYGDIEIHYQGGARDVVPLLCGFTLDAGYKLLSPSKTLHLHTSCDPYQYYLAITPRNEPIEKLRLVARPDSPPARITAITCETDAQSGSLSPLPPSAVSAPEAAWIDAHSISPQTLDLERIRSEIAAAHKRPC